MKTEYQPRRHVSAMDRAEHLQRIADETGVDVAKLIRPANSWKTQPERRVKLTQISFDEVVEILDAKRKLPQATITQVRDKRKP